MNYRRDDRLVFVLIMESSLASAQLSPQKTKDIYDKLRDILGDQESAKLYFEFLKRNNRVGTLILKSTKVNLLL
jgi:hypothetical protein